MKRIKLIHNPAAGEGDNTISTIISTLREQGYDCSLSSTQEVEEGKIITNGADFIVLSGGDGTVRKTALTFRNNPVVIAILPMGTANNIAKALDIRGECHEIIEQWATSTVLKFDVGEISNLPEEPYFLEGVGFGVFPKLMHDMKGSSEEGQKKMDKALETLYDIVMDYKAVRCTIRVDGVQLTGNYLMAEVMNIRSIGPNLHLVPSADPSDGELDVVLIEESQRERLARYVKTKMQDTEDCDRGEYNFFTTLKAKKVTIDWAGDDFHVDDKRITLKKNQVLEISVRPSELSFLVPAEYTNKRAKYEQ